MSYRPPDEMVTRWRAELDALLLSRKHEAVEALIRDLDTERREALEDFDRRWSNNSDGGNESPPGNPAARQVTATRPQEGGVVRNGSSSEAFAGFQVSGPRSTRQMVMEVMPEFQGDEFGQGDVREKIVARWPDADDKYLASRVSKLLKEMSSKGILSRHREGDNRWDAFIYRVNGDREGSLLEP